MNSQMTYVRVGDKIFKVKGNTDKIANRIELVKKFIKNMGEGDSIVDVDISLASSREVEIHKDEIK